VVNIQIGGTPLVHSRRPHHSKKATFLIATSFKLKILLKTKEAFWIPPKNFLVSLYHQLKPL
jgi:hypothetical protein